MSKIIINDQNKALVVNGNALKLPLEFYKYLIFDGTAYIDTNIYIPENASFAVTIGNETLKSTQRCFLIGNATDGYTGVIWGGNTNSSRRQVVPYYDSASYLSSNTYYEFTYPSISLFLTPYKFGAGNNPHSITKGSLKPNHPLIIGSNSSHNGQAFTGSIQTFYVLGSDAQNETTYSGLLTHTPVYTLRPCLFAGEAGLWCAETSMFYGNTAGTGELTTSN